MALQAKAGRKTGSASKKLKLTGISSEGNSKVPPQRSEAVVLRVRAIALGYYGAQLREEGDAFELRDAAHFSSSWMEKA